MFKYLFYLGFVCFFLIGNSAKSHENQSIPRADTHAPIGVMGEHQHHQGKWMASYRYMYMHMDGQRSGTNSLSSDEVFAQGFNTSDLEMDMQKHIFGLMQAPTDWLTLMIMIPYIEKDMKMIQNPHSMMNMMPHMSSIHKHASSGLGDIVISNLFPLWNCQHQKILGGFGISIPTGDVEVQDSGRLLAYGMELGSGTWDLIPNIVYTGNLDPWAWGIQLKGILRLEDEGRSGFSLGDMFLANSWVSYSFTTFLSSSLRLSFQTEDSIEGSLENFNLTSSPSDFPENYGGEILNFGWGMNYIIPKGSFAGNRLAIELLTPIYQDLNGIGMERKITLVVGWKLAWG